MMKLSYGIVFFIGTRTVLYSISKVERDKFEAAIEADRLDTVRSLLKAYEAKNLSVQERKAYLERLALTARDVVIDRNERLSLWLNPDYLITAEESEKTHDIALMEPGSGLIALGGWYASSAYACFQDRVNRSGNRLSELYQKLAYESGIMALSVAR